MVMVPVSALQASNAVRRSEMALYGVQLVNKGEVIWAKKPTWLRKVPHTAINPHLGQAETRVKFSKIAKEAAGKSADAIAREIKGKVYTTPRGGKLIICPDGQILPKVAAYIKYKMKDYRAEDRLEPKEYPSRLRRTLHTAEELKEYIEKIKGKKE